MSSSDARSRILSELRAFLGFAYSLKAIADYETGPDSEVPPETAADAVERSKRFVAKLTALVEDARGDAPF